MNATLGDGWIQNWTRSLPISYFFNMFQTLYLPQFAFLSFLMLSSCSNQMEVPGDTSVNTRTVSDDPAPGNIMAEGRIETSGD